MRKYLAAAPNAAKDCGTQGRCTPTTGERGPTSFPLGLHRRMGNWGLARWLARKGAQRHAALSHPHDPAERDADRLADRIMTMPNPGIQGSCASCQRSARPCARCRQGKAETMLRQVTGGSAGQPEPATVIPAGAGRPLEPATRTFFEPRLGIDLREVNIHTGADAASSARALGARAYTVGSHIVFGAGEYVPETAQGRRLLAHELVHVVQQGSEAHGAGFDSATIHRTPAAPAAAAAAEVTIGTVLAWCLSGAAISVLIDQAIQMIGWALRGLVRQNWCKTIISALFGCVFGMVGGAIRTMVFSTVARFTIAEIVQWVYQRLVGAGAAWLAGKWAVTMAKLGCNRDESRM